MSVCGEHECLRMSRPEDQSWLSFFLKYYLLFCCYGVCFCNFFSLCITDWPGTHRDPLASTSPVLGLKVCATMPGHHLLFESGSFPGTGVSPIRLVWLSKESQGSVCLCLPIAGLHMHLATTKFFTWVLRTCSHGKQFTDCTISSSCVLWFSGILWERDLPFSYPMISFGAIN